MKKVCKECGKDFEITNKDLDFFDRVKVPVPEICSFCREQERLAFRNERYYYSQNCEICKKRMISVYDPKFVKNEYCHSCWWSEKWGAKDYGRDFDFNRPFFEQYRGLLDSVPKPAMMNDNGTGSKNSEYTYDVSRCKNAYLVIGSWHVWDCFYGFQINHVENCIDNYFVNESKLMYSCAMCEKCYACQECTQCSGSNDCIFGYDLKGCKDCLLCAGLRNKQYCILNKQYEKEEYLRMKEEFDFGSWENREKAREKFLEFLKTIPRKYANLINCENCTGDNLVNSKDSFYCFNQRNLHSCKFMSSGDGAKNCYDCWSTGGPELCYNCITPDLSYNVIFSIYCWKTRDVAYSDNCHSCQHIFGCVGMKRSKYCILNKQYSEEDYFALREKIVEHMKKNGEWGEFFPSYIAPFAYNETPAHEWYPLGKEEARQKGYRWCEELPGSYEKETISWEEVPSDIKDVDKTYIKQIFPCIKCKRNYKVQDKEFLFYKEQNIPLPRLCVDCRYDRRKELMNPRELRNGECLKCGVGFETSYPKDTPYKVYCEKCYLEEVY